MFGSAFPTLVLSWCLAAGSSGMCVSCWDHSPDDAKAAKPPMPPTRARTAPGTRGGDCPLKSFSGSGCLAPCRPEPWGCCSYFFPSGLLYFTLLGLDRAVGPDSVTRGVVHPCLAPLLCPSCPQPALGMAWPGRGGSSKHPRVDPLVWVLWEVARGGPRPPWWHRQPQCRMSIPFHPVCPLHPFVLWCHAGAVPRGDSIVHACPHPSPLPPPAPLPWPLGSPRRAGLALGWGSHFPAALAKNLCPALSWWQFPGGTGSPVSGCTSVCLSRGGGAGTRAGSVPPTPLCATRCLSQPPPYEDVPTAVPVPGWHRRSVRTSGSRVGSQPRPRRGDMVKRCSPAVLLMPLSPAAGPAAFPGMPALYK